MKSSSIPAVLAAVFLLASTSGQARSYLVLSDRGELPPGLNNSVAIAGGRITQLLPQVGAALVESTSQAFAENASRIGGISAVLPNPRWKTSRSLFATFEAGAPVAGPLSQPPVIADGAFPLQWPLLAINALGAWAGGHFGAGVRVAVLDSGIAASHVDLAPAVNTLLSRSFVPVEAFDYTGSSPYHHGTHVAGIIAARLNGAGTVGVAPQAELVAVKVLSADTGNGSFGGVLAGILYASEIDAQVINLSLGTRFPRSGFVDDNGTEDPTDDVAVSARELSSLVALFNQVTLYAHRRGSTLIAAAGNDGFDRDHDRNTYVLPADSPHVLTVSATGPIGWAKHPSSSSLDHPASYSDFGQSRIDLAAPGGDFAYPGNDNSTVAGLTRPTWVFDMVFGPTQRSPLVAGGANIYGWAAGTSMAAPHVSGIAALIIAKHGGQMNPSAVAAALRASADDLGKPGNDDYYGQGRVNAGRAVQ